MEVRLETRQAQTIHGLWAESGDKTIAKDIPALSGRYYAVVGKAPGSVLPFYVVSRGYDPATGHFALFIGGDGPHAGLEALALPRGLYGRVTVRPRLGFLWGPAIGAAKGIFYGKWLPASGHEALNLEYELHTAQSVGKSPRIELLFALKK